MTWPETLTDNTALTKHVFVQLLTDLLESGETFAELHKGAALAIRRHLETVGGVPNADNITNSEIYEAAAANWLVWQVLRGQVEPEYQKSANEFRIEYLTQLSKASPQLSVSPASGGPVAPVGVRKFGATHYTDTRPGAIFDDYRR